MAIGSESEGDSDFVGSIFKLLEFGVASGAEVFKERERAKAQEAAALANQQTARIAASALDRDKAFDLQLAQISAAAAIKTKEVEAAGGGTGLDISKNDLLLIGGGLLAFFMVMQFADGK